MSTSSSDASSAYSATPVYAFHPFLRATHPFDPSSTSSSTFSSAADGCLAFEAGEIILLHSFHFSGWGDGTSLSSGRRGWVPSNYCVPYDTLQIRPLLAAALTVLTGPSMDSSRDFQIAATTLVSGIRSLLDSVGCLTRDGAALQKSQELRRSRRRLLTEVSVMISCVKKASIEFNSLTAEMVSLTHKIVVSAADFLAIYNAKEAAKRYSDSLPSLEYASSEKDDDVRVYDRESKRSSFAEDVFEYQPVSALARLNFLYDALLVRLGGFINRTLIDGRSPAKLLVAIRQAVHAAREFLAVVETISAHASPVIYSLEEAKETMYQRITMLVASARDVVGAGTDQQAVLIETQTLGIAVTECVRSAGACLGRSKYVIDRVGDFDLEVERQYLNFQIRSHADNLQRSNRGPASAVGRVCDEDPTLAMSALALAEAEKRAALSSENEHRVKRTPLQDRIIYNSDGQVQGGSIEALVKHLTANDATPDVLFVSSFFLTFRLFTTPVALAQALVHRFASLSPDEPNLLAAQLRVYNAFKGWMESHWRKETDNEALPIIVDFANGSLKTQLPFAYRRLLELSQMVVDIVNPLVPRSMSKLGINTSLAILLPDSSSVPTPIVNKLHLAILAKNVHGGGPPPSILDFDPLEFARQITIKESRLFCQITPEELLGQEFAKKSGKSIAVNVKAMSSLSTDLANYIGETILAGDVPLKFRMNVIRHWIRVAEKCLELKNYNCLMAVTCALQSSVILRLKKTWELLPPRYHALFAELKSIIVYEKNYASYRTLLRKQIVPCLPYLGVYLTDLTFADEGNSDYRIFHPDTEDASPVINFDKHVRSTKIIADLQRFQVPYRFQEVPEIQEWLDVEIARVHEMYQKDQHMLYRRSCLVEPRVGAPNGRFIAVVGDTAIKEGISWNEEIKR
ncbi:ras guanine nucleotide exchange factor domain-containing protein [Myxozyma melibiosi]|uniref:Ras guanine nucleotide exchange factor domain-containing protein n=1 Tax=Myxozyma melibiosi TaxID=54550 RepID=A0ABR1F7J5_9ASCO